MQQMHDMQLAKARLNHQSKAQALCNHCPQKDQGASVLNDAHASIWHLKCIAVVAESVKLCFAMQQQNWGGR